MFPRERGSNTLEHNRGDQRCAQVELAHLDADAECELCALNTAREQAQAAFNLTFREVGS